MEEPIQWQGQTVSFLNYYLSFKILRYYSLLLAELKMTIFKLKILLFFWLVCGVFWFLFCFVLTMLAIETQWSSVAPPCWNYSCIYSSWCWGNPITVSTVYLVSLSPVLIIHILTFRSLSVRGLLWHSIAVTWPLGSWKTEVLWVTGADRINLGWLFARMVTGERADVGMKDLCTFQPQQWLCMWPFLKMHRLHWDVVQGHWCLAHQSPGLTPAAPYKIKTLTFAIDHFKKNLPNPVDYELSPSIQAWGSKAAGWEGPDSAAPPSHARLRLAVLSFRAFSHSARGRKPRRNSFQSQMWCQGSLSKTHRGKSRKALQQGVRTHATGL